MQYFCAQCQAKHDVTDIKFDMYHICQKTVAEQLMLLRKGYQDDESTTAFSNIVKFVNSQQDSGPYFHFSRSEILAHLDQQEDGGNSIVGTFTLTLRWVLDSYSNYVLSHEKTGSASKLTSLSKLARMEKSVVFSQDMDFHFHILPGSGEVVADNIAPGRVDRANRFTRHSTMRSCPHCGKNVSTVVGKAPEIVIAATGVERAGKTSCITAITSALRKNKELYNGLGIKMLEPSNDPQWEVLLKEIEIYDQGYVVTKTPKNQTEVPSYSYMINVQKDKDHNRVLTFVDMPGEFWNGKSGLTDEFFEQYAGLFHNIDCIWLFIPRLAVQKVDLGVEGDKDERELNEIERKHRDNQRRLRALSADSAVTIAGSSAAKIESTLISLSSYLNKSIVDENGRKIAAKGMPPVAMILTKTELLEDPSNPEEAKMIEKYNLFPARNGRLVTANTQSINKAEINRILGYDKEKKSYYISEFNFYNSSRLVRNYLSSRNKPLMEAIEDYCPNHFFIAMAAYGHPAAPQPDDKGDAAPRKENQVLIKPMPPTPYHEMYPLVWTLAISADYPIQHGCKWHTYSFMSRLLNTGNSVETEGFEYVNFDYKHFLSSNAKPSKNPDESAMKEKDVASNLLFNPINDGYTYTNFNHPRR